MGKQIILIIVLCFLTAAKAQKKSLSYKQVDRTTYAYYLKQDWKPLLEMGKKSRADGIDFYYLKVRMGIAYFKLRNYDSALDRFMFAYHSISYQKSANSRTRAVVNIARTYTKLNKAEKGLSYLKASFLKIENVDDELLKHFSLIIRQITFHTETEMEIGI